MATNAFPKDPATVREMIEAYLDASPENLGTPLPRTYMGLPVDLSNLDAPISGMVVRRSKERPA
jgi:hypothetical protein